MEIDKYISNLVETQFPQFYQAENEKFVAFIRAYYEWMEQEGYTINASKNLLEYIDIDNTLEQFISSFKNEFLMNFPSITAANKRFMIKNIKDFYQSKGSTRGLQLLFRLLFDDDIEVYVPGKDILKPSDGIWTVPNYIEVEHTQRSKSFVGKRIFGSESGAEAFVESVYTKVINSRLIDIITISGVDGNFQYDEVITDDGNFFNAPKVIGSLTSIAITDGGANNRVGDVYDVYASTNGKGGKARVAAVEDGTGRVIFTLVDGGSGYSNVTGQVKISEKVLTTENRTPNNQYFIYEVVTQPLNTIVFSITSPASINTAALYQTNMYGWSGATQVATGKVAAIGSNPNTFIINVLTGNFFSASEIKTEANAISFTAYTVTNSTATGLVTGSNSTAVGLHNINNTFYGNGAYIVSNTGVASSNIIADVVRTSSGSGANFDIGSLKDTEILKLFTDFIGDNNVGAIPYLNLLITGGNSNVGLTTGTGSITTSTATNAVTGSGTNFTTQLIVGSGLYDSSNVYIGSVNSISGPTSLVLTNNALLSQTTAAFKYNLGQYGFPKDQGKGFTAYINDVLDSNVFTIGTIASLKAVNPGSGYDTKPFVLVRNDIIAGYNRKNIILEIMNKSGIFSIGDSLTQNVTVPTITMGYNANTGAFTVGEGITQDIGLPANSVATIDSINTSTSTMVLRDMIGNILANNAGGQAILGLSSGSTANVTIATPVNVTRVGRGHIVSFPDPNTLEIKRDSFNESFTGGSVIFSSSGGTANVVAAYQNTNSLAMGNNAVITANVSTAKGIATRLEVINSGYGHQPGDTIELINNNNIYAITGTANVINEGIGEGYWKNTQGMLNSDKYIIDGEYYQSFSYEVQTRLSLSKYADIIRQLAHVVGTKMFGKVLIDSRSITPLQPITINYKDSYILARDNSYLLDRQGNNIIQINRNYTVSGYTGILVVDRFENTMVDYQDQAILLRED
jgi:hypothetical protein